MGRETDVDSILALDKRIEELTAELIRLKRSRNSLSHVARVPPEILGYIFRFKITTEVDDPQFAGIQKDTYNFLLVCHHWFEVARHLPELWSFWGNSLGVWKRQLLHSAGTSPLDLVLGRAERRVGSVDETLQDALKDYTTRNAIRKVHLMGDDMCLLTTIVSSLIPEDRRFRDSNIESIALNGVDVSDLLSSQRFPKLRDLSLSGRFVISPWALDCLKSNTAALVNLSLSLTSSILTTSQILSLLASNPNIQSLSLESLQVENDGGRDSETRVLLLRLEKLSLKGDLHLLPIMRQLELPERVDYKLEFYSRYPDVREIITPHIRDYLHRDPRFKDRLGIFVQCTISTVSLRASVVDVGYHSPGGLPQQAPPYATFLVKLTGHIDRGATAQLCIDILALLPRESVVYFETNLSMTVTMEAIVAMPNLEALYLIDTVVCDGFLLPKPDGPNAHRKLLPSLQRLYLEDTVAEYHDWSPLFRYVAHQSSGNHRFSLFLFGDYTHVCSGVAEEIGGLVEEFAYNRDVSCPLGKCNY
jgi:hypothetical protein